MPLLPSRLLLLLFCCYLPALPAAGGGMLELWFEYDGRPASLNSEPLIACLEQEGRRPFNCRSYRSDDGRYWVERPGPGRYLLQISVDQNRGNGPRQPGDLYREYPFRVNAGTTGPLLVSLHQLIALQEPASSAAAVPGVTAGCEHKPEYSAALLALFPAAQLDFSWQPLDGAARYHYKLWRVRCSDGMRMEQVFYRQTQNSRITEAVPPNRPGEYYRFELSAVNDGQTIGQLLLQDGQGRTAGEFHFVVSDPLIDRSWLYYLLALLLLLFLFWVVVGAWRGRASGKRMPQASDIRRRRSFRPLLLLVLLAVGATAYWQRESLRPWLEQAWPEALALLQQGREWLEGDEPTTPSVGEKAAASVLSEGRWRGIIVSASREPFSGEERRAEIRLEVAGNTARVALLQQGRWQDVTAGAFTLQPAGSGVTLFGHRRAADRSELWTISIPEIEGPVLRLSLDRMITRRDTAGRAVSSERRQASGELRKIVP